MIFILCLPHSVRGLLFKTVQETVASSVKVEKLFMKMDTNKDQRHGENMLCRVMEGIMISYVSKTEKEG